MPTITNFYDRLGVPEDASDEDIRKAYREAARCLHPDVNVDAGATELFLKINEAYKILIDPVKRSTYDSRVPKEAKAPPPVRIHTHYSRSALPQMTEKQLLYALIEMEVLADLFKEVDSSPPTNVAVVLDCSTSMQGGRLDMVKASAIELVSQLKLQDIFSIIAFNDRAEIVLPPASHANNHKSAASIRMLQANGGTEIYKGLYAGLLEVQKNLSSSYINHIILITDGHTYGDERICKDLAGQAANLGIGISCLGIGSEWNDSFLDELAKITGGSCLYIGQPIEIRKLLKQKFDRLGQVYVERINFKFKLGAGVQLRYAFRLQPEVGVLPTSSPLRLGNIPKGSRQSLLLEFLVSPIAPEIKNVLLAESHISFDIPMQAKSRYHIPITLVRPVREAIKPEPPPQIIVEAMSHLTLYRMQEQAKKEIAVGDYEDAIRRLQYMSTHLFSRGEPALAKTALSEAKHIQQHQELSQKGEKQIKYGTRALLLPVGQRKTPKL